MATNNHNRLHLPDLDLELPGHIEPMNSQHNEAMDLGQKLLMHHGHDAALKIGPSNYGSMAVRLSDVPSSSRAVHIVGNTGASHASFGHYPGSSSSRISETAVIYPHRSDVSIAPVSSRLENRRAALKRKNPIVHHGDLDGYDVGSSSNTQVSNYPQPNPTSLTESLTQMPLSIGQSDWNGQQLLQQEEFQRNVRARHNHNISLDPRPDLTRTANGNYLPPLQSTASAAPSTLLARNPTPISVPTRTAPSGAPGITSRGLIVRPYYPATGSSSSSVAVVSTAHGSSGNVTFASGGYAPRTVNSVYSHPAFAGVSRAVPHETVIPNCPPGFSAASSTSLGIGQSCPPGFTPLRIGQPTRSGASSRYARNVAIGHATNGRHRRARSSYFASHLSFVEAERLMLDRLAFYEARASADPHRDMRLDVDNMSYEDLLALGEFIGNVNVGLAEDKISASVREVVCCSSDALQNDEDDGTCVVCLEEYKDKDLLGTLKCNHDFHAECIKKWLKLKNSCPVCKSAAD